MDSLESDISEAVRVFFDSVNAQDAGQLRMWLHPEVLLDDGQERVRGLESVVNWIQEHLIEANTTLEIVDFAVLDSEVNLVNARRQGGFGEGGQLRTLEETYFFLISEAKIALLTIRFVSGSDSIDGIMRDITLGELQKSEDEMERIYKTENEKLTVWKDEIAGFGLENDIASCQDRLQKAHSAANEFKSVVVDFKAHLSKGLGGCLRIYWQNVAAQSAKLIPEGDRLVIGEELLRERRELDAKHAELLFEELERTEFRAVPAAVEKIVLSLNEEDRLPFKMNAALIVTQLSSLVSAIRIALSTIELGTIWRSFLYAYVIERYGDKLRRGEQVDALSELWTGMVFKMLPGGEVAQEAIDAAKKLVLVENRAKHVPSLFSELKEAQDYLLAYSGLLARVEFLLENNAKTIRSLASIIQG